MSLTGCSRYAPARDRVAERVEMMALLWQIQDGSSHYCANSDLMLLAWLLPELQEDAAFLILLELRKSSRRDRIIKNLVLSAHGHPVARDMADLATALDDLSGRWDALAVAIDSLIKAAYGRMRASADGLAEGLDPAADLAMVTGASDPLEIIVLPSLFLPPPQTGRHGVLVEQDGAAIAYLLYGYPLKTDPKSFGINRFMLMGGAWHYAVQRFLARHWPSVADDLRRLPMLEAVLTAALEAHRETVMWPNIIADHVSLSLKCKLCASRNLPELVHRSFAQTQGMALFDWFRAWIDEATRQPPGFADALRRLPSIMHERQDELVATAAAASSGPVSISFALASRSHPVVVVIPDHWAGEIGRRIARRWSGLTGSLCPASEWRRGADGSATSAIVFSQIGLDRASDELLVRDGFRLCRSAEGGDVLVSLRGARSARRPWQIAIAVHDPDVAGEVSIEHLIKLSRKTARFVDLRLVSGDDASP